MSARTKKAPSIPHVNENDDPPVAAGVMSAPQPIWPLPSLAGQWPVILTRSNRRAVELAYARSSRDAATKVQPISDPDLARFEIPYRTPVFAAFDGNVVEVGVDGGGYTIVLQHPHGWASVYSHIRYPRLALTLGGHHSDPPQRVKRGRVIGYVGGELETAVVPLGFRLLLYSRRRCAWSEVDPIRNLQDWPLEPWVIDHRAPVRCLTLAEVGARVARLDAEETSTRDLANACKTAA